MSQSSGEKTELPTPKRLREAREKGQVCQSKEVVSTAVILVVFAVLAGLQGGFIDTLKEMMLAPASVTGRPFREGLDMLFGTLLPGINGIVLPVVMLAFAAAVVGAFAQIGVIIAFEPMKPELKKINPAENIKKIFGMKNLLDFVKNVVKVTALGILLYLVLRDAVQDLMRIPVCGAECLWTVMASIVRQLVIYSVALFVIGAAVDYAMQHRFFMKDMKMTKDEVKREYKEMEGNPEIKSMRKSLHREMLNNSMAQGVRKATVVVTNPTHIAVAIYYDKEQTPLPMVVAKGEDMLAKRIVQIAEEEGIPVLQNIPLARALNSDAEVNQYIPSDLIQPVAEVLRWVQQMTGR